MKTFLTLIFTLSCFMVINAYGQSNVGKSYKTIIDGIYQQSDLEGNTVKASSSEKYTTLTDTVALGKKFTIYKEIENKYVIRFSNKKDGVYHLIEKGELENSTIEQNPKACKRKNNIDKQTSVNRKVNQCNTNTYVVEYDFQTGLYKQNQLKPHVNTPIVFKVVNVNRLAYQVKVTAKDSAIGYSDLSGMYEQLKKEEVDIIKQASEKEPSLSTTIPLLLNSHDLKKSESQKTNLKPNTKHHELTKQINAITLELSNSQDSLLSLIDTTSINSLNNLKLTKNLKKMDLLNEVTIEDDNWKAHFEIQEKMNLSYLKSNKYYRIISSLKNDFLYTNALINDPLLTKFSEYNYDTLKQIFIRFKDNLSIYDQFLVEIKIFRNLYVQMKNNLEAIDELNYGGKIKVAYIATSQASDLDAIDIYLKEIKFQKIQQDILSLSVFLDFDKQKNVDKLNKVFEYTSDPVQPTQDMVVFDVQITKNDKTNLPYHDEKKFTHKEFTRFGLRFDVSVGVGGSIHFKQNSFDLQHKQNGTEVGDYVIVKQKQNSFLPSFMGFFTTSYRSATHWTGGLSVGIGIGADQGAITFDNFFVGASLIVGKYERATFTGGLSIRNLPQLKTVYQEWEIVPESFTIDNITSKSYQPGVFVAFSYNLTKGVKDNIKYMKKSVLF